MKTDNLYFKTHKVFNTGRTRFKKGMIVSVETRKKLSEALKGKKKKPFSEEHRKRLSLAHQGEKSSLWKGGISKIKGYRSLMNIKIAENSHPVLSEL